MAELNRRYNVHHFPLLPKPEDIPADVAQRIRGVATEANRGLTRALLDTLPNLEVISVFGVGTDAVDLKAAKERGIPVTNTPDIIGPEVRRPRHRHDARVGAADRRSPNIMRARVDWAKKGPMPLGRSVGNKTMGVIGLGGIGRAIADRAVAFRMKRALQRARARRRTCPTPSSPTSWNWRGRATT